MLANLPVGPVRARRRYAHEALRRCRTSRQSLEHVGRRIDELAQGIGFTPRTNERYNRRPASDRGIEGVVQRRALLSDRSRSFRRDLSREQFRSGGDKTWQLKRS